MSQYDSIGASYKNLYNLPGQAPEKASVINVLGDVKDLNCLDLACGLGRWSHLLVEQGAAHVTGIDISEAMITNARETLLNLPEDQRIKINFHAGDCGKPFVAPNAPFDLVLAVWFLNYASCYDELLGMWRNIHANLKPGGSFVALTSNAFCGFDVPFDNRYGIGTTVLNQTEEGGYKCRVTAFTQPEKVEFDNFSYPPGFMNEQLPRLAWRN